MQAVKDKPVPIRERRLFMVENEATYTGRWKSMTGSEANGTSVIRG